MTTLTLLGFDPGIKDTGGTALQLDFTRKHLTIQTEVWSGVSQRIAKLPVTSDVFLKNAEMFTRQQPKGLTMIGIEGYRQRGYDIYADQAMLQIISDLKTRIPKALVIDNTGIKNVVKPGLLKMFHCGRFEKTNHADLKSAARVALKLGINNEALNMLVSDYVLDHLEGREWTHESMSTLYL